MSESASAVQSSAPQQSTEPVVIAGGDSPASWDELESLTATPKKESKSKESKDLPKESKEESKSKKEAKEEKGDKKKEEGIEKPLTPAKLLKLKNGEAELDVAADALVPVKIDGKVIEVPLQEAINRYSQQSHLDKLYKTYKTEKEGFDKQRESMSAALNKSYDYLVNQKDLRGFLEYISEAMGVDGDQLYQETVGTLQKQLEELNSLSPEERKIKELEQEVSRFKSRKEAEASQREMAKSRAALESQVNKIMEDHGMDKAALVQAWDDLTGQGYSSEEITPEFLAAYHSNTQKIQAVESKLAEINPELAKNMDVVESLATFAIQTNATGEEIAEAITQLYSDSPEKKLSKKIERNQRASAQKGSNSIKNAGSDPLFFDDI